jgi:aconitate hydratase
MHEMSELQVGERRYRFHDVAARLERLGLEPGTLPYSLRVLAENVMRTAGDEADALLGAIAARARDVDLPFRPARVVLQDLLGTPALVDLAGLRDAVAEGGGDPTRVNPVIPTHLVVDHSVNVDHWGSDGAMAANMDIEQVKNRERFAFLDWCNQAFDNLSIIPSGNGILHQVNLERLTPAIVAEPMPDGGVLAYPDTLVGTDSHTTMINAIGVLGWGVGGIEAEAAMLGKSLTLRLPDIVGIRLEGEPPAGYIATDIALALTETLRREGVIGALLEFFGPGVAQLSLADRATLSNMAPEFGATAALFPLDRRSIDYLRMTGRDPECCALAEHYARRQGLWADSLERVRYDRVVTLDLGSVRRAIAGPLQPHQHIPLGRRDIAAPPASGLQDGAVVIAAITSCTNTSNSRAVISAALLARNARARGLSSAPWVKTSFAPGSRVVTDYLKAAGLNTALDELGFNLVGYGCMTCNGMSGPLASHEVEEEIRRRQLQVAAVTSGNRNFAGRVHPLAREVFIMSPPLIVAYALAGTTQLDPERDPLCLDADGRPVYLRELWPADDEVAAIEARCLNAELFIQAYQPPAVGQSTRAAAVPARYPWAADSTYIRRPPYWSSELGAGSQQRDLRDMRVLAMLGDHITTDHISPSGAILPGSDAGRYLLERGIGEAEFNSYGTRRGNHEAAQRATFANPRLLNELCPDGREGPYTRLLPDNTLTTIFTAARAYLARRQPLLVIAGREYGSGSSRDWAAKGPRLLGVRVVLAESFERIHRANLAGMGILPLQFEEGQSRHSLALTGEETFTLAGLDAAPRPGQRLTLTLTDAGGNHRAIAVRCRLDTEEEIRYFRHGGLLPALLAGYLPA